jgi:phosphoglycolate phosphatase
MPIKAILFDLDGTLVDSAGDLRDALNALLAEEGLAPLDLEAVKDMVGDGVAKLVERGLAARGAGLDGVPVRVARFMELYEPNAARLTRPYPQVAETLEALRERGLRLAVVTNKPHAATVRILDTLDLARFFDAVVGGDTFDRRKPDSAPLLHAMQALDATPTEALMVGDNHHDVAAAHAAGMPVAVVAYGYGRRPAELGADRVLDSFAALCGLVDGPESRDDPPAGPQVPSTDAVQPASASRRSRLTSASLRPDRAGTWKE